MRWWESERAEVPECLPQPPALNDLWKSTALPRSHQPGILLEIAIRVKYCGYFTCSSLFPSLIEFCWRGKLLFFKFWGFFTFLQKTKFLSSGTLRTAIFHHSIQGVITWGCARRIRGQGSQTHQGRVNWDCSEWKSRGNITTLLNYTKICWKIKGMLFSVQITSEREQEVGLNLELERWISNIRKMFVMERMAETG